MGIALDEQVRGHFLKALTVPDIVDGAKEVERAREDPYSVEETKKVNIKDGGGQSKVFGATVDDNEDTVIVSVYVRPESGENWETLAAALRVAIHARIMNYAWPTWVSRIRKIDRDPQADAADRTPGMVTTKYAVRYLSTANALDQTPT